MLPVPAVQLVLLTVIFCNGGNMEGRGRDDFIMTLMYPWTLVSCHCGHPSV